MSTWRQYREPYNPEVHPNHGKPWTTKELMYLCSMYDGTAKHDLSLALGRTHSSILTMADTLRRQGLFERYKKLGEQM